MLFSLKSLYFQQSKMYNNYKHTNIPVGTQTMTVEAVPIENIVRQHFIPAGLTFVYMPLTRLAADSGLWLRPFPSSPKEKKHIVVLFSHFLVISLLVDNHYVHHYSSHRSYPSAFPDPCKPNMPSNPIRQSPLYF